MNAVCDRKTKHSSRGIFYKIHCEKSPLIEIHLIHFGEKSLFTYFANQMNSIITNPPFVEERYPIFITIIFFTESN